MKTIPLAVASFALVLAGCDTIPATFTSDELDAALNDINAYSDAIRADKVVYVTPPTSGTATYTGTIDIVEYTSDDTASGAFGRMSLTADFDANSISGEAFEFSELELEYDAGTVYVSLGDGLSGTLLLTNGVISDDAFVADLAGTLEDSSGTESDISSGIRGDFTSINGSSVVYVEGGGSGISITNGTTTLVDVNFLTSDN